MVSSAGPDPFSIRVARDFLARVAGDYPVAQALLYGSRARADARPDSNLDIAFILYGPTSDARKASVDLAGHAFDIMLETGLCLSPMAISKDDWHRPAQHSNPYLIRNIRRDGDPL